LAFTALREAEEELAIPANKVELVGALSSLYVPPSNYLIQPYVGFSEKRFDFVPEQKEVAQYFEIPLNNLIGHEKVIQQELMLQRGLKQKVRGYPLDQNLIWGATGMMVKEFAEILEEFK
jgi:8-oxo-dGTP pyrophosphatase MutT (NUDIX family)